MLGGNRGKYLLLAVGAALFAGYAVTVTRREEKAVESVVPKDVEPGVTHVVEPGVAADAEYLLEMKAGVETIHSLQTDYPKALHLLAEAYRRLDADDATNPRHIISNRLIRHSLVGIVGDQRVFLNTQLESKALSEAELLDFLTGDINCAMSILSGDDDAPWKEALRLPGVVLVKIIRLAKTNRPLFQALMSDGLSEDISNALSPTARDATNGATVGLFANKVIPADIALMIGENIPMMTQNAMSRL